MCSTHKEQVDADLRFHQSSIMNARYNRDLVGRHTIINCGTTTDQFLTDVGTGRSRMNIY
jgi:hypothetical protein